MLSIDSVTGTNFAYEKFPLTDWLDDMVKLERKELELWGVSQHIDLFNLTVPAVRNLKRQLEERDLHVSVVTPEQILYPVNFASEDQVIIDHTERMFRNAAELTAELGGDIVFITPGWTWENSDLDEGRKRSAARIHDFVGYADKLGLRCVLESLQRYETNLVTNSNELAMVFDAIDAPTIGIALDTVAMATAGEGIHDYFNRFGDKIWHVHLVDGSPSGHRAWGDGNLPLTQYLKDLRDVGYDALMTAEIFGAVYTYDPFAAHGNNLTVIREAFESLGAGK